MCKLAPNGQSRNRSGEMSNCDSADKEVSPVNKDNDDPIVNYEVHTDSELRSPPPYSSNVLNAYHIGAEFDDKLTNIAKAFGCEKIDILYQAILLYEKVSLSKGKLILNTNGLKEKITFPYNGDDF